MLGKMAKTVDAEAQGEEIRQIVRYIDYESISRN
jgi:hypothetical protein